MPLLLAVGVGLYLITRNRENKVDKDFPVKHPALPTYPNNEAPAVQRILPRKTALFV